MRTKNLLKLAFTMLAMIVMTGAMAQDPWDGKDPVKIYKQSTRVIDPTAVTYDYSVTVGKKMPFWVWPSAVYNPNFVETGFDNDYPTRTEIETNVNSSFAWKFVANPADLGGATAIAGFTKNYVEIDMPTTTGNRIVEVIETAPSGFCAGDAVYFGIKVINPPFANINETFSTKLGIANVIADGCSPVAKNLTVAFGNTDEVGNYHVVPTITAQTYELNGDGTALINGVAATVPAALEISATDNSPITLAAAGELIASREYTTIGDKPTVYEISLNKWNAKISRMSDYYDIRENGKDKTRPDSYTYYTYASSGQSDGEVVARIIVMPKPVTGPIYHIPSSWAL